PSFALHIMETMRKKGIDPRSLSLKIGLLGAEPWSPEVQKILEENLGFKAFDIYGVMELIEPGVAGECAARTGLHIAEDHFLPEVIDPESGKVLGPGQEGELVLTTLTTSAYPLLRYRTSDVTFLQTDTCSCGRTLARMSRVVKRSDKMISVRGINVFPEKIAEVFTGVEGIGPRYSLDVGRKHGMNDHLKITVEASPAILGGSETMRNAVQDSLKLALRRAIGLRVDVDLKAMV
ncbi:MAG TPA: phenylacetate--CoA ligase, partial [Thermodesulfobacteriota bacterium]|nr:phenylacetate--CoA ligase [Thermodesulfobacteriota bacterium]